MFRSVFVEGFGGSRGRETGIAQTGMKLPFLLIVKSRGDKVQLPLIGGAEVTHFVVERTISEDTC